MQIPSTLLATRSPALMAAASNVPTQQAETFEAELAAQMPNGVEAAPDEAEQAEVREAFQSFVGQTLFAQMLQAMRKTQNEPAYFHGGQAEEVFQQQLDQVLAEKMSDAWGEHLAEPMFDLFTLSRP